MNNIQKRFLLFLIGCIGVRSLFVVIAKNIDISEHIDFEEIVEKIDYKEIVKEMMETLKSRR